MTYDSKVHTRTQAIAEKVLLTMAHNHMWGSCEIADIPDLRDEERRWIPWTPETLVFALQLWDSAISLPKVNEVLELLATSGLIIRRYDPPIHHELTTTGRVEAERLGN